MDLIDLWRGTTTIRNLCWRLSQLPAESRTAQREVREIDPTSLIPREPSPFDWDATQYMLADIIDVLQTHTYLLEILIQKDAKSPKKPRKPEPYQRPGNSKYVTKQEDKKFATASDLKGLWG